ncbi:ammonium transporter Rh type A-like [Ornithodoros turicata]|uniref:ammonium transporter Rh type A-like n=1 Tax=Ornithodoros turicata TaxID=34597 RepID=UPI0031391B6A
MVYIGFGFLMTFLKRYGYGATGFTFLLSAIVSQWAIFTRGIWRLDGSKIRIDIESILGAEFAAVTFLISYGAVLGKTSIIQLSTMALTETVLGSCNEYLGAEVFRAMDAGGSIFLHSFGAYFGLGVAFVLHRKDALGHRNECSSYQSDVFAMIGTMFLWMFWPSFNGVAIHGAERHRAVVNTYLSMSASCVIAFAISASFDELGRLNMVHIQNSSLAGGVAVGSVAHVITEPHSAVIIGMTAGALSVFGYKYISPFLANSWRTHDTCGVHNLHGLPGVLAGITSIIVAASATWNHYGESLYLLYPARVPAANSTAYTRMNTTLPVVPGLGRTAAEQALYQLCALCATIAIAVAGGVATGLLIRLDSFNVVSSHVLYEDGLHWKVAEPDAPPVIQMSQKSRLPHLNLPHLQPFSLLLFIPFCRALPRANDNGESVSTLPPLPFGATTTIDSDAP